MESKLFWAVNREWISLLSGSDPLANNLMDIILEQNKLDDHQLLPPDAVEELITFSANSCPLPHAQLDEDWKKNALRNLCTLAACNVDFKRLTRQCRAHINYAAVAGVPSEQVLDLNLRQFLRFGRDLDNRVQILEENSSEVMALRGLLKHVTLFKVQQNCRRLFRWVERAALIDLIHKPAHVLSEVGHARLEQFRIHPRTRDVPDDVARTIFTAVDRRHAWATFEQLQISREEFSITTLTVAHTVNRIRGGTWEGSLREQVLFGIDDNFFGDADAGAFVHDDFAELGQWAPAAQVYYEQGLSVDQAINRAKELAASQREIDGFLNVTPGNEAVGHGAQAGPSHRAESTRDDALEEVEDVIKTGSEFIKELVKDFGADRAIEFDTIDLGLTGVIGAGAEQIAETLRRAFSREHPVKTSVGGEWRDSLQRTDVKFVALSYKHKSTDVRMGDKTIEKVAAALHKIADTHGCDKINIWLDAIMSGNKNQANWAVRGLYPYLVCDVVIVLGDDGGYSDNNNTSMWMRVEDMCADEKTKIAVTLDRSPRGYSIQKLPSLFALHSTARNFSPDFDSASADLLNRSSKLRSEWSGTTFSSVKARMMMTAQELCKGALIRTLASWPEDKRHLLLWAEQCMLQNQPVLFGAGLDTLETLQADNLEESNVVAYLTSARDRGFIEHGSSRKRGGIRGLWKGALELLPGLSEASRRDFVKLLYGIEEEQKIRERVTVEGMASADVVTISVGGMLVSVKFAPGNYVLEDVWVDVRDDLSVHNRAGSTFLYNSSTPGEIGVSVEKVSLPLKDDDEKLWAEGQGAQDNASENG